MKNEKFMLILFKPPQRLVGTTWDYGTLERNHMAHLHSIIFLTEDEKKDGIKPVDASDSRYNGMHWGSRHHLGSIRETLANLLRRVKDE